MSSRFGIGNRLRWVRLNPATRPASDMSIWNRGSSPEAVLTLQTLGTTPEVPDRSTA